MVMTLERQIKNILCYFICNQFFILWWLLIAPFMTVSLTAITHVHIHIPRERERTWTWSVYCKLELSHNTNIMGGGGRGEGVCIFIFTYDNNSGNNIVRSYGKSKHVFTSYTLCDINTELMHSAVFNIPYYMTRYMPPSDHYWSFN